MSKAKGKPGHFKFSIIAGALKGKSITAPDFGITRPPLSRLRKAIFDFMMPYIGEAHYLDLFSGTGAYLFEAVSRGAQYAQGVELERKLVEAINRQATDLGVGGRPFCSGEDVFTAVPRLAAKGERYDVIMIAPPQYQGFIDRTLTTLRAHPLYAPSTIIICQHDTSETDKINFGDFPIDQQRKYGNTTFTILRPE